MTRNTFCVIIQYHDDNGSSKLELILHLTLKTPSRSEELYVALLNILHQNSKDKLFVKFESFFDLDISPYHAKRKYKYLNTQMA